jgi:hypothetical protein
MSDPGNWEDANRRDPVTYWKQGKAHCPTCGTVQIYMARVEVADLVCDCGTTCLPACGDEANMGRHA